jgi:hypothetical protein
MADNFPSKAFFAIEYCDNNDSTVACWSEDGRKFVVKDTSKFAATHLPRYFKHSNFQSFVRQLNLYGFHTVKQDSKNDGSVVFYHDDFRRGRQDLLTNITRSKKNDRKNHKPEETKEEQYPSFNHRFDELQQQMDLMSQKLDLIISLVSGKETDACSAHYPMTFGGKRLRRDDWRAKSPASTTDTTFVSDVSSQSSISSCHAVGSPRSTFNMGVVKEQKMYEHSSSDSQVDDDNEPEGLDDKDLVNTDDFKDFMDMLLDDDEPVADQAAQQRYWEQEPDSSTVLVDDRLMNKTAPDTVEGVQQATTDSAIQTVSGEEDYDEEAGVYEESSPPLTTAVEVTNERSIPGRHGRRRTGIYIAIGVVAVLITAIVWPLVVFIKGPKEDGNHPPPRPAGNGGNGGNDQGWQGNGTWHDSTERGASPVSSKGPPATIFSHADQQPALVDKDVLQLTLSDKRYECHVEL